MFETMKIKALQAFKLVMEEGSLLQAGLSMGLSEAAISRLITELEQTSGLQLFDRSKRQLSPTKEARMFYVSATNALSKVDQLTEHARDIRSGDSSRLSVAVTPEAFNIIFATAVSRFTQEYPRVNIKISIIPSEQLQLITKSDEYDVGFSLLPIFSPAVETEQILTTAAMGLVSINHPLAANAELTPHDIVNERLITLSSNNLLRIRWEEWFRSSGIQLCHTIELDSYLGLNQLIMTGAGITVSDTLSLDYLDQTRIKLIPLKNAFENTYGIVRPHPHERKRTTTVEFENTLKSMALRYEETSA